MTRIWGILRSKDKIVSDTVVTFSGEQPPTLYEALEELCKLLDVPRPVMLSKHENEYASFFRTRFSPSDFIESVHFSFMDVEILRDKKKS